MTDTDLEIIVFVLLAVAIGVYVCVSSSIKRKKAAENAIKKAWGKRAVYKGTDESFEYISHYAKGNPSESMIDDITWNDLGMDEVFKCINNTNSSVGQEYLYKMLREPVADAEKLHHLGIFSRFCIQKQHFSFIRQHNSIRIQILIILSFTASLILLCTDCHFSEPSK